MTFVNYGANSKRGAPPQEAPSTKRSKVDLTTNAHKMLIQRMQSDKMERGQMIQELEKEQFQLRAAIREYKKEMAAVSGWEEEDEQWLDLIEQLRRVDQSIVEAKDSLRFGS